MRRHILWLKPITNLLFARCATYRTTLSEKSISLSLFWNSRPTFSTFCASKTLWPVPCRVHTYTVCLRSSRICGNCHRSTFRSRVPIIALSFTFEVFAYPLFHTHKTIFCDISIDKSCSFVSLAFRRAAFDRLPSISHPGIGSCTGPVVDHFDGLVCIRTYVTGRGVVCPFNILQ